MYKYLFISKTLYFYYILFHIIIIFIFKILTFFLNNFKKIIFFYKQINLNKCVIVIVFIETNMKN